MTANDLISQLEFNQFTLRRLLADVSHADSLFEPKPGISSINFLLGHLLNTRDRMLKLLGRDGLLDAQTASTYIGKPKAYAASAAVSFDTFREILETSFTTLQQALPTSEAKFSDPSPRKFIRDGETVGDQLGFFICHEEYHVGQIGLLRRLMDKPGLF
jgi:hypothetical protein